MEWTATTVAAFEQLQILRDDDAGIVAIVAIHDTRLGPAFGGIRRWSYRRIDEAIADALRLAEAMTNKCAVAGVAGGGGKTVLLDRPGLDRAAAYRLIGRHVEEMGGRYYTGPDAGTDESDLEVVAAETDFVARPDRVGNLADPTAIGVFAGIRAVAQRLGFSGIEGLRVLVQGLGEVGSRLVRRLVDAGARVLVSDVRRDAMMRVVDDCAVACIDPGDVFGVEIDVWAPCALGGVVHDVSLQHLKMRAIAGSANNVLASREHGRLLFERGVLYAPDFVINAGALLHGALFHLEGRTPPPSRIEHIGDVVGEILDRARSEGRPPEEVATSLARERLGALPHRPFLPRCRARAARGGGS
ncbi:MAG: leucine dehydrogenase [Planctomycetes bacterium]|nr:leucine dehydrogenase [Planctomycetota bacterium]